MSRMPRRDTLPFFPRRTLIAPWVLVLVPVLAVLALAARPAQAVEPGQTETIDFSAFQITVVADAQDDFMPVFQVHVTHAGAPFLTTESRMRDPSEVEVREDFPAPGMRTLVLTTYSGGAHCCHTAYFLSSGPNGDSAVKLEQGMAEPLLDQAESDASGNAVVPLLVGVFDYYSLDGEHTLCHACSPIMRRMLVYTPQGWRADTPGEFPDYYAARIAELDQNQSNVPEIMAPTAMMRAYFSLMAGSSPKRVRGDLSRWLPPEWRDVADQVMADLTTSLTEYSPVKVLELP